MADDESYKAHGFAAFADAPKRDIETRRVTHRDYPDKRYRQAGWTVIARRGAEVVTAIWIEDVAIGPIGWYSTPRLNGTATESSERSPNRRVVAPSLPVDLAEDHAP